MNKTKSGKTKYILSRAYFLIIFFILPAAALAQTRITGIVVDAQNEPIIGASIIIKGTSLGTVTDTDGRYSLQAKNGDIISISYIGFKQEERTVTNSRIDVVLYEDAQVINEVIVTGYGAVSRKNLTTSIVKVKADDVVKTGTTNMSQMLMGRAAGLQASLSSAQPGGGVNMTIRGGGQPLYVVDGVVMPTDELIGSSGGTSTVIPSSINRSGLAGLNPDDIESIEVLKDASAAIYGINAANGVILITTKQGKAGRMKVSYEGAISSVANYKYLNQLQAKDYMTYANIFKKEQYLFNHQMTPYGPNAYDGGNSDAYTAEQIAAAQNTDWTGYILKNGFITSHNVTIQGGAERLTYYVSGNYYKQNGTVANSSYERFVLRANVGAQVFKWLKITTAINYNKNINNNSLVGGTTAGRGAQASGALTAALSYPTNLPLYNEAGNYSAYLTIPNPVGMLDMTNRSYLEGFNANFTFDATIIPEMLTARVLYGYNSENTKRDVYIPSNVYFDQMYKARGSLVRSDRDNTTIEAMINFNRSFFDGKLTVDAMAGMGRYLNNSSGYTLTQYYTRDNYDGPKK